MIFSHVKANVFTLTNHNMSFCELSDRSHKKQQFYAKEINYKMACRWYEIKIKHINHLFRPYKNQSPWRKRLSLFLLRGFAVTFVYDTRKKLTKTLQKVYAINISFNNCFPNMDVSKCRERGQKKTPNIYCIYIFLPRLVEFKYFLNWSKEVILWVSLKKEI